MIHCGSRAASGNKTRISQVATIPPLEQVPEDRPASPWPSLLLSLAKQYGGLPYNNADGRIFLDPVAPPRGSSTKIDT